VHALSGASAFATGNALSEVVVTILMPLSGDSESFCLLAGGAMESKKKKREREHQTQKRVGQYQKVSSISASEKMYRQLKEKLDLRVVGFY